MSRWMSIILAGLLALTLAPGRALAQAQPALTVPAGEVLHGDLASLGEPIMIAGTVEGDVTSWSGSITVLGEVRGDVVSYAGSIDIGPDAQVMGSVLSLGGGVRREERARVSGRMISQEALVGGRALANAAQLLRPQRGVAAAMSPMPLFTIALTLMSLLVAIACAAIWPRRTLGVSLALRRAPWRSALFGLLTTALAAMLLLPLGGLLALSLVGLPLLLPLILILQAPYLFGLAGLGLALGERVRPNASHPIAAAAGIAMLLVPLGLIGVAAPLWSATLFYAVASIGLGAAILSRGGAYAIRS